MSGVQPEIEKERLSEASEEQRSEMGARIRRCIRAETELRERLMQLRQENDMRARLLTRWQQSRD